MDHLLNALGTHYKYMVDWTGYNYFGLTVEWSYNNSYMGVSMPGYIKDAMRKFKYIPINNSRYSPHEYFLVDYTNHDTTQYTTAPYTSPVLAPKEIKYIQSMLGTFLYYDRALDSTILPALNDISVQQAVPTANTMKKSKRLLNYTATYLDAYLRYYSSVMTLHVESDASYLVLPKAKNRIAG